MSNKHKRDIEKYLARGYIAGDNHESLAAAATALETSILRVERTASRMISRDGRLHSAHLARRAARAERARVRRADEWRREESKRRASSAEVA
jgi:hypothetical protein